MSNTELAIPENCAYHCHFLNGKYAILAFITHDGPMSSHEIDEPPRPDAMIHLELWSNEEYNAGWIKEYTTPKESGIPFMGAGSNDDAFVKNIGWKLVMWLGDILSGDHRKRLINICQTILKSRGFRIQPEPFKDDWQDDVDFVKPNVFYFLNEGEYKGYKVWLKRRFNKDNTLTSRWTFVRENKWRKMTFIVEQKFSFTDTAPYHERPMTLKEACEQFDSERYGAVNQWALENGYSVESKN